MNEPEYFALADRTLGAVVARIGDDQWEMVMPESFATSRGGSRADWFRWASPSRCLDTAGRRDPPSVGVSRRC